MIHVAALLAAASSTTTTLASQAHKSSGILDPIAKPVAWVLAEIYSVIPNVGIAIVILSIIWMIIISPLTLKSTRSMLAMQKLQPQLKKLQEQHKDDKAAFAQAQMDLFREHQVSPFGSCLPMLLPLPVFFALFRVIQGLGRTDPKYLSPSTRLYQDIHAAHGHLNAFGMDLSQKALAHHSSFVTALPFWIALLVMAGTSYMQSAQMMSRNPASQNNPQMRMMKYLPLIFVVFCINFPAGVIVYYATSNICRIIQQDAMYRFDPKVKALVAQEVEEVEEMTREIDERGDRGGAKPPATKPAAPKANTTGANGGGRMRFRDVLAAAQQQQQKARETKAGGGDGKGSSTGRTPTGGNGAKSQGSAPNGKARSGGGSTGSGAAGKGGSRPGGHRTNRKRRGR